jgi:hypothetical protein
MSEFLTTTELTQLRSAAQAYPWPFPTQVISNGEFMPAPQNACQREVEGRMKQLCDELSARYGLDRRTFLASDAGMASAFIAMNEVYGEVFAIAPAEASEPGVAGTRAESLSSQTIIDLHTHFLRDDSGPGLSYFAELREKTREKHENPQLPDRPATLEDLHLGTYVREMWFDSDTKMVALSPEHPRISAGTGCCRTTPSRKRATASITSPVRGACCRISYLRRDSPVGLSRSIAASSSCIPMPGRATPSATTLTRT